MTTKTKTEKITQRANIYKQYKKQQQTTHTISKTSQGAQQQTPQNL